MKTEDVRKILSWYLLIKGGLGLIGVLLFVTGYYELTSYASYLTYLFGDSGLFRVTALLPVFLAALALFGFYAIRKDLGYARLIVVIALIPDVFFFPLGTIISIVMIGISLTKTVDFKPMATSDRPYRLVGAGIIVVSLVFIFFSTGVSNNLTGSMSASEQSVQVLDASLVNQTGSVDVIIELTTPPASVQALEAQQVFIQNVQQVGGIVTDSVYMNDNALRVTVNAQDLAALASNPAVKQIIPNKMIVNITGDMQETMLLDNSFKLLNAEQLWANGITGKGIVVAVVDTGINAELPIFQRDGKSIVIDSLQLYGEHVFWHGSAVASCIASQDAKRKGIAPGVDLLNVEVFQSTANGVGAMTWDILKGWDWVAQWKVAHHRTVICCNSLGAPSWVTGAKSLDSKAENMVLINNIPMIIAAGNGYPTQPMSMLINSPGQAKDVLTVGAVDDTKYLATFSCRGKTNYGTSKPDVVAPGVNILMFDDNGKPITASGTSFATPMTAGVCALLAQQHPDFSAKQLQDAIKYGADKTVIPHATSDYGNGFVNAQVALSVADGQKPETSQSYTLLAFPIIGIIILLYPDIKKFRI